MKVLNVVSLQTHGGVEVIYSEFGTKTHGLEQATYLSSSRAHPSIQQKFDELRHPWFPHNKVAGVSLPKWRWARDWNFRRVLKETKPDLVVGWNRLHHFPQLPKGLPFVHYEHGTSWYQHEEREAQGILERADRIITASHAAKRVLELRWFKSPQSKISVNRNALPHSRSVPGERSPNSKLRLGFAGRFHPVKAPWVVVRLMHWLRQQGVEAEVLFAGKGELFASTQALAAQLGVQESIQFLGPVSDMPAFYRSIDYLVCPSVSEPFGLVPLEAMAQGCLPLVTNVDGLVESLGEYAAMFSVMAELTEAEAVAQGGAPLKTLEQVYEPQTDRLRELRYLAPDAIGRQLLTLESNATETARLRTQLQTRALQDYRYEDYVKRQVQLYQMTLGL